MNSIHISALRDGDDRWRYLHLVRVVASMMVVLTHVTSGIMDSYDQTGDIPYGIIFLNALTRSAVPLFLMITGTLFLSRKSFSTASRVAKIVTPLMVWNIIYLVLLQYQSLIPVLNLLPVRELSETKYANLDVSQYLIDMTVRSVSPPYHLWYLYVLVGIYLMMPILQKIVQHLEKKDLEYGLILWIVFTLGWSTLQSLRQFIPFLPKGIDISIPLFTDLMGYVFLGYYVDQYRLMHTRGSGWRYGIGYLFISVIMLVRVIVQDVTWRLGGGIITTSFENNALYVGIQALTLFVFLYQITQRKSSIRQYTSDRFWRFIVILSQLSFVSYLSHVLILEVIQVGVVKRFSMQGFPYITILALFASMITIILSYMFAFFVSKLPKKMAYILGY
ncbi:acyltransferase family protein [Entomospira nematocerorum]|nr:acyltransferase family protein [Entomospira nematocera]WDI34143.1 acyltransferase family protein [Entomospira nematocera]